MVYVKYLLGKTGLFPKWEPRVEDVLYAAVRSHEVEYVITPRGYSYYYVIPKKYDLRYLYDLTRVFRANGIILFPHKSYKYSSVVFRVSANGQDFMRDVVRVNKDTDAFQNVLAEHGVKASIKDVRDLVNLIKQNKSKDEIFLNTRCY